MTNCLDAMTRFWGKTNNLKFALIFSMRNSDNADVNPNRNINILNSFKPD